MQHSEEIIQQIVQLREEGYSFRAISDMVFGSRSQESTVRGIVRRAFEEKSEETNERHSQYQQDQIISLQKSLQQARDQNNLHRKINRNIDREVNALSVLYEEIHNALKDAIFAHPANSYHITEDKDNTKVGIIQLSDLHFGETTDNSLPYKHDNEVAYRKLKHFHNEVYKTFSQNGIKKVVIAFTGDMMNSDRRLDEVTMNSGTRAQTLVEALDILQEFIANTATWADEVYVASVIGNESRIGQFVSWAAHTATDNFDYIIHNCLNMLFQNNSKVKFISMDDDVHEKLLDIDGFKLLLAHGNNTLASKNPEAEVSKLKGRYADKGQNVDYVIFGHIHSTMITDTFARSASLVGGNGYSDKNLNLSSKASQNYYIIDTKNKTIKGSNVDLTFHGLQSITQQDLLPESGRYKAIKITV